MVPHIMRYFKNKQEFGWVMYDWANSAFATTIMAGFFPVFFKQYWSYGAEVTKSTAILGAANSAYGLSIAFIAPILGAIADQGSNKKKFLIFFTYLGVLATAALFMVQKGNWLLAAITYVIGAIGFSGSMIFYDSFLPLVSSEKRLDFVSAFGYAMGYLGGGILFTLNVLMTLKPHLFGLADASQAVRLSFVSVAVWWAIFSIPLMLFVKEPKARSERSIKDGLKQLLGTFQKVRHLKTVFLFLIAYWFYIDGVFTIIKMAVDYGLSIGFQSNDLIVALLITQFVAFPSAIVFGRAGQKFGAKRSIYFAIAMYMLIVFWAINMTQKYEFFILAIGVGLVQGGIQALSRSFYARIIPHDQSAEFFGFFNLIGKASVIMGPMLVGGIGLLTNNSRAGIASILILFVIGWILLHFVDEEKGKKEVKHLKLSG
ncbi:MFS transporter [Bdellovibrionota bacterium]